MKLQRDGAFNAAQHIETFPEPQICYNCGTSTPEGFYNRKNGRVLCPACVTLAVTRQAQEAKDGTATPAATEPDRVPIADQLAARLKKLAERPTPQPQVSGQGGGTGGTARPKPTDG